MKRLVLLAIVLAVLGVTLAQAGEKEELQAKLVALLQEGRAANAEWELYQIKMQDLQQRFPEIKKEQSVIQEKLKAIEAKEKADKEAKEKAAPKPVPEKK